MSQYTTPATSPRRTLQFGNENWLLPFRAGAAWVTDARGKNFAECNSPLIAQALVKTLNAVGADQTPIKAV
jgi:hypothetical protein